MEAAAALGLPVRLTSPDRVIFPEAGLTKRQLAEYYLAVGHLLVPEIAGRPLSLVRCPQGRARHCFFQKHDSGGFGDSVRHIDLHEVTSEGRDRQPYLYVDSVEGVLDVVQMGTIELHIWGSRVPDEERPDRLVFDLDPDEGLGFYVVVAGAREVRARLKAQKLESFPMLTGGKGLHVVVPIRPEQDWAAVKEWCRSFAQAIARDAPDRYTATLSRAARKGRIFVDYPRNGRGATAIAPYSVRAREGAPVAAPVGWDELDRLVPGRYRVADAAELIARARRLKGWGRAAQSLTLNKA